MRYSTVVQFLRFCLVGGVGLLLNMGITYLGVEYFHVWYLFAYCAAALLGWTVIFIGNALFTFPEHEQHSYARKYVSFVAGYLGLFWVNTLLVYFFVSVLSVFYIVSIALATVITTLLTFTYSRKLIFHE